MAQKLLYPGVPVYMAGKNYYIPSLGTRDFREHYEELSKPASEESTVVDTFDRFIPIIGLAIRRNYPDVTDELLADLLDIYTFNQAVKAVQNASGMTPVTEGE